MMVLSAMDLGWRRVHLLVFLTFLKYAFGYEGWIPQDVQPQQDWPIHKHFSPRGLQSSVLTAPATGSIPFEEVAPNVVPGKSTSGSLALSQSTGSKNIPGLYVKLLAAPPVFSQSTSGQSSNRPYTSSSRSPVGPPLKTSYQYVPVQGGIYGPSAQRQGTSSQYAPGLSLGEKLPMSSQYYQATQSGSPSPSWVSPKWRPSASVSQGLQASGAAVLQGSGTSQSSSWSPSRSPVLSSAGGSISQKAPVTLVAKVPVYSQAAQSGQPSQWQPSATRLQFSGLGASQSSPPSQDPSQSASSLYSLVSPAYGKPSSSLLDVSSQSASGQSSYTKYTPISQRRAGTQLPDSSPYVPVSTSTDGSLLQLQGTAALSGPPTLDAKVPVYSQGVPSGSSALTQTSWLKPSTSRWSQGFQASGAVTSDSSSPPQGSKVPSRFSITSAASPSKFASAQDARVKYSGLAVQPQSTSKLYSPGYGKFPASPLGVGQSTSGQSASSQYTPSSQSSAGTWVQGSTNYAPVQTGSTSTDLSTLQLPSISSLYDPMPPSAKVPVYGLAAQRVPSVSRLQPSKWQSSPSWSQGFQTSGTVVLQSGAPSQGSKALSRFPTLSSVASTGQFASTQGSVGYSGLSRPSQDVSSPSSPGSSAYAKRGSSLSLSSQSTSDQSSSGPYSSDSQSVAGTQLAGSNLYVPAQTGSTSSGAPLKIHSCNHRAPSVSCNCNAASSGSPSTGSQAPQKQGFQASGMAVPLGNSPPQSPVSTSQTSSFFVGLRPTKLLAQAAAGSAIGSQISPGVPASVQYPSDSMTSSVVSRVQGDLQGQLSGQSIDSSSYDQDPSQDSSTG
ncbi:endochitinase A [Puntigrus tetrazona]|uniref:endochitinase A n=1 Tax=Puntigrus tetrazona TaxID=1606681 RepID=UPI001C89740D|nr:endochitinase A [Puntigrus tetrazona]